MDAEFCPGWAADAAVAGGGQASEPEAGKDGPAADLLELTGLDAHAGNKATQLSGGQRRKLDSG